MTVCLVSWTTHAASPNDAFADSILLVGSHIAATGNNVGATREPGEPYHAGNAGGKSVWWSWTAPASGWLFVSTAGSMDADGLALDTVLGVYSGSQLDQLWEMGSGDDTEDVTSSVMIRVQAHVTYHIAVDGYSSSHAPEAAEGSIHLSLDFKETFPAPAWALPDPALKLVRSEQFHGQVILLNFWATWCGPCVAEIPDLIQLYSELGPYGLSVIGVSVDQEVNNGPPAALLAGFVQAKGINYPVVLSRPEGTLELAYQGISAIPTTFIIDRENRVVDYLVGSRNKAAYAQAVAPYLTRLQLGMTAGQLCLSWPDLGANCDLQTADDISSSTWSNAGWAISRINGQCQVTLSPGGGQRFFRLAFY